MPVVWSDRCLLHEPAAEIWVGIDDTARPRRRRDRPPSSRPSTRGSSRRSRTRDESLLAVHDAGLLDYLASAWGTGRPRAAGDPGQDRVVPYVFAAPGARRAARRAGRGLGRRPGYFAYDTMTLVGPGTWEAARAAADCALTAVDLVLGGEPVAYACTRPPGHHAARARLRRLLLPEQRRDRRGALSRGLGPRVAVLDVDAHHGNGTQEIFAGRDDVLAGSVHVDPAAGWFPHFLGFADESGAGNRTCRCAPGSGDEAWLAAVGRARAVGARRRGARRRPRRRRGGAATRRARSR